jgi:pilus assembly protein Flp/PilA
MRALQKLLRDEKGQGLTEYIVIVALVAVAAIGVVTLYGDNVRKIFGTAVDALAGKSIKDTGAKEKGRVAGERTLRDFAEHAGRR